MPKKEEVDNIYLTPEQIQEMLNLDLSTKEAVKKRLESLDISEDEKLAQLSKCRITHIRTLEHVRDIFIGAKVLNKEQDKASILGQLRKFTEQIRTQAKEKQRTREAVKDGR